MRIKTAITALIFTSLCLMSPADAAEETSAGRGYREPDETSLDRIVSGDIIISEIRIEKGLVEIITQDGKELKFNLGSKGTTVPRIPELPELEKIIYPPKDIPKVPDDIKVTPPMKKKLRDVIKIGTDYVVEESDIVYNDLTVISGDITVKGQVEGDVTAIDGDILVTSTGKVYGNASSIGGKVEKEPGAVITGEKITTPIIAGIKKPIIRPRLGELVFFLVFLILALVVITLAPRNVSKVQNTIQNQTLKTLLFGYLVIFLLPIIALVLIVTVIGIPVALIAIPLLTFAAIILGFTAISSIVGAKFLRIIKSPDKPILITVLIGAALIQAASLIGYLFGMFPGFLGWTGNLFAVLGALLIILIILPISCGSAALTRMGTLPRDTNISAPSIENE
jgi:hypothetical protein